MKNLLLLFSLLLLSPFVRSHENILQFKKNSFELCYGLANIGRDSVENHRAGAEMERDFLIALREESTGPKYYLDTLMVIIEGYKWKCSTHEYGMRVAHHCAKGDYLFKKTFDPKQKVIVENPKECVYNIGR